jgi:hypothetical protein
MTLARLPQPRREWYSTDQEFQWNDILWRKLGQAGFDALINSENITGILARESGHWGGIELHEQCDVPTRSMSMPRIRR